MNIEKFIYNRRSAAVITLLSALVMLLTPYPYYDNVMVVFVSIWVASLLNTNSIFWLNSDLSERRLGFS